MLTNAQTELAELKAKQFLEYMGVEYPYKPPPKQFHSSPNKNKSVIVADPHCPYETLAVRKEIEAKHKDAYWFRLAGDLWDFYTKSRFEKTKEVSFSGELRSGFFFMEWVSTHFTEAEFMIGNHDNRCEKMLLREIADPSLMMLTEQNLMAYMASFFDNINIVGQEIGGSKVLRHIWQCGDVIFTHAEISNRQESSLLNKISQYLHEWKDVLKLKPYRVIMQAHNHVADNLPRGTEHWYSLPTASDPYGIGMEYIFSSRLMGKPPQVGYTIMYQTDGITDCNETRHYLVK